MKQVCLVWILLGVCVASAYGAPVILNEYNAVGGSKYLNDGDATADIDGGYASDSYFGRVMGNGGDWFELVVTTDHVDMRRWKFVIDSDVTTLEVLNLTNNDIWSDLRIGTIITISEDVPDDVIYDPYGPLAGDWWINVQASTSGTGDYIERQNFPVNNDNWQLVIKNVMAEVVFGPAGEGVILNGPLVSSTEIFRLEADPSASITPYSAYYDDAKRLSTFGAPNQ